MIKNPISSRVWLEIRLGSIRRNFLRIQKTVRPALVMGVLKADAYGLGAKGIAKILVEAGVDRMGVAELKEAIPLRQQFKIPVQILSALLEREIPDCVRHGIICPIADLRTARLLSQESIRQKKPVTVHLKIDTGMGRLGIPYPEAEKLIPLILRLPGLIVEGISSHFADANHPKVPHSRRQLERFKTLLADLKRKGIVFSLVHMANSDGINNYPKAYFNMVRTGINLYGVFDLLGYRTYRLSPTLSLKSSLIAKRKLPKGSTIGYGHTYLLSQDTWVGTVPAGYADGVPLAASNKGSVLIRGRLCPIIGRISMDYLTVDLSPCPRVKIGDEVILIGRSRHKEITIEDWARLKKTHPYDIICSLGQRVERVYLP